MIFFPDATRYQSETRILSGRRLELQTQLGRLPTGDENALRLYQVYRDQTPLGAVMVRRVKGAFGAIELVLAVDTNQLVRGVRVQRQREPDPIAAAIQDPRWLNSFTGKSAASSWPPALAEVPAESRPSAEAMADGVRSLLVQLALTLEEPREVRTASHH